MSDVYIRARGSKRFHLMRQMLNPIPIYYAVCNQSMYRPDSFINTSFEEMQEKYTPCKMGCFKKEEEA